MADRECRDDPIHAGVRQRNVLRAPLKPLDARVATGTASHDRRRLYRADSEAFFRQRNAVVACTRADVRDGRAWL